MKVGFCMLLWSTHVTEAHLPVIERLKQIGYDGVELPMFAPDDAKFAKLGKKLSELGLARTAVTIRGEGDNPISPDAKVRAAMASGKSTEETAKSLKLSTATVEKCAAAKPTSGTQGAKK